MSGYSCPNCGAPIGFGEAICPSCKSDVTSVWEMASPKKDTPKVAPGMGGLDDQSSPFPPAGGGASPFPPAGGGGANSPFPPPAGGGGANSPFPPPAGGGGTNSSPFPAPAAAASPFPPPAAGASKAFPPAAASPAAPAAPTSGPHFDIPDIAGKLYIPLDKPSFHIGRDEIQGVATKALPDLNAYKNISRARSNNTGVYSEHFIIHVNQGKCSIEDQHSTNGTYLGTMKLKGMPAQPLKDGDKVILPIEEHGKMVQLEIFFKSS
jgi:FHA domain